MGRFAEAIDWKYAAAVLAVVGAVVWLLQAPYAEIRVCRSVLEGLARGRLSVQRRVDWERLRAMDLNVGLAYASLPNEPERARYRRAFIEQFANGFVGSGARASNFVHWRVVERRPGSVVVAADYPAKGKTLLMTMAAAGKRQVQAIEWQE